MSRNVKSNRPGKRQRPAWMLRAACAALLCGLAGPGCAEVEDRPSSWSYVYSTVVVPSCTTGNCHVSVVATAGLQFTSLEGTYTYLTGRTCRPALAPDPELEPDHNFVVPFQPESSKLTRLLRGEEVRTMPPDLPLPEVEIEIVERWILEGAECN